MNIILDANILFSASRPNSLMEKFVALLLKRAVCCTNLYAWDEAYRNLAAQGRAVNLERLGDLREKLAIVTAFAPTADFALRDKDKPILFGAIAACCTHLLTGDRQDFGPFFEKTVRGVKIVSPELLALELKLEETPGK